LYVSSLRVLRHATYQTWQSLKRVEVIEDDEAEIVEAVRRMSERYDFVVTRQVSCKQPTEFLTLTLFSGGIGPT
jgi:molybdopterin-biosynthesis enzyme MoeA-like protein